MLDNRLRCLAFGNFCFALVARFWGTRPSTSGLLHLHCLTGRIIMRNARICLSRFTPIHCGRSHSFASAVCTHTNVFHFKFFLVVFVAFSLGLDLHMLLNKCHEMSSNFNSSNGAALNENGNNFRCKCTGRRMPGMFGSVQKCFQAISPHYLANNWKIVVKESRIQVPNRPWRKLDFAPLSPGVNFREIVDEGFVRSQPT